MISKPNKNPVDVKLYQMNQLITHYIKTIRKVSSPETNACDNRKEANT